MAGNLVCLYNKNIINEPIPALPNVNQIIPNIGFEKTGVIHNTPKIIAEIEKPIIAPIAKIVYSLIIDIKFGNYSQVVLLQVRVRFCFRSNFII